MAELMLDEKRKKSLDEFVAAMKSLYGDRLTALYLVGDGATEPGSLGARHLKLVAVMSVIDMDVLGRYAGIHATWHGKGIAAPLMMTWKTIESSTDIFPMEFLEMKESNVLLFGEDVLAGLDVGTENLRRECEEQVKGKLIHFRQSYMESGGDEALIISLISTSIEPFADVMRNLLRLMGRPVPAGREAIIKAFCAEAGLDEHPFAEALRMRQGAVRMKKAEADRLYALYLAELVKLAEKVDKMEV
ncbi:MAG: hypothetical protein HZC51_12300 [Nitrospirae bacterium]|nr:hypothetical protein [Nitrospirota bacterium]